MVCTVQIEEKMVPPPKNLEPTYKIGDNTQIWIERMVGATKKKCDNIGQHARQWFLHTLTIVNLFVGITKKSFQEGFEGK